MNWTIAPWAVRKQAQFNVARSRGRKAITRARHGYLTGMSNRTRGLMAYQCSGSDTGRRRSWQFWRGSPTIGSSTGSFVTGRQRDYPGLDHVHDQDAGCTGGRSRCRRHKILPYTINRDRLLRELGAVLFTRTPLSGHPESSNDMKNRIKVLVATTVASLAIGVLAPLPASGKVPRPFPSSTASEWRCVPVHSKRVSTLSPSAICSAAIQNWSRRRFWRRATCRRRRGPRRPEIPAPCSSGRCRKAGRS